VQRLKDRVAIVTGGGRGIGRDIALAYAKEGAHVVVSDIDPVTAKKTSEDIVNLGQQSIYCATNVAISADIQTLTQKTIAEFGRVDILVNNAMKIVPGKLEELPEEAWDTTMNIGLKGSF
jgi:NAD(P)-dependent dehydrogenase (short-subunit alcohol dehydrogenase family)